MIVSLKLINSEPVLRTKIYFWNMQLSIPTLCVGWHLFLEFQFYCSNYDQYFMDTANLKGKTYLSICLFVLSRFSPNFLAMKGLLDPITQLDIPIAKKCQERIDANFFLRQHLYNNNLCIKNDAYQKNRSVESAHLIWGSQLCRYCLRWHTTLWPSCYSGF